MATLAVSLDTFHHLMTTDVFDYVTSRGDFRGAYLPDVHSTTWEESATGNESISVTEAWPSADNANADDDDDDGGDTATWVYVLDRCQMVCTSVGFLANVLTLLTLIVHRGGFSRMILILLRHQSLVDSWVCLMASIVLLQPYMWLTGQPVLDIIVCHAWHGQAFYWGAVTLSTYNLVVIAWERYMAICHPFTHCKMCKTSTKTIAVGFAGLYLVTLLVTHGTYIQTQIRDGECVTEYAFDGQAVETYFFAFVIFTYVTTYFVPVVLMAVLYALIVHRLHVRSKRDDLGHYKTISRASAELTKTAIAVTVIFSVTIGYDLHYYLLGYTGVTEYRLNTAIQKIGVFLSNLNSCANPFVYALFMPIYRRNVLRTFKCYRDQSGPCSTQNDSSIQEQAGITMSNIHVQVNGSEQTQETAVA